MASISSAGLGSGLDVQGLVDQLVTSEGQPTQERLDRKEVGIQASLSAIGTFKSALGEVKSSLTGLQTASAFQKKSVTVNREGFVSASAGAEAFPGRYRIEVESLASAQRLSSGVFTADTDTVGSGTLTFQRGRVDAASGAFVPDPKQPPVSVDITAENSSLRGIATAINDADIGMRASIINSGEGFVLVLGSESSGAQSSLRITVLDADGNDSDTFGLSALAFDPGAPEGGGRNLTENTAARDAVVIVDGITVASASNTLTDVIPGLKLELESVTDGQGVTVDVEADREAVVAAINGFVEAFNTFVANANELTRFDPETRERGPLLGDAAVRGVMSQLRRIVSDSYAEVNDRYPSLASIGIQTERDGTLSVDGARLQAAIDTDFEEVTRLFARTGMVDDPLARFADAGRDEAQTGRYRVDVISMPQAGSLLGGPLGGLPLSLAGDETLSLVVDGVNSGAIRLGAGTWASAQELASELEGRINADGALSAAGITVSVLVEGNALRITSGTTGSASRVDIVSIAPALATSLGLAVGEGTPGQDLQGRIGGLPTVMEGNRLTGTGAASGLSVEILGGSEGIRGDILFSRGVAQRLNALIDNINGGDGALAARNEGLNRQIEDIDGQRLRLQRRLEKLEDRLRRQFSGLDATLGSLQETSTFLNNQLAALPGARQSNR
ncbi:MAG TPA: flagellar hook protein [Gammaproteobacteria bacterium]|nr:flagellar hook protein [Gammaproteobacteria bacterium]